MDRILKMIKSLKIFENYGFFYLYKKIYIIKQVGKVGKFIPSFLMV